MCNVELTQVNLVQCQCVNLTAPGTNLELNVEINHTASTVSAGLLQASTKINLTTKNVDLAAPFSITFELRSLFKAPADISSDAAFGESARIVFPFVQANLSQFCNLLSLPPIMLPLNAIPSTPPADN